MKPNSAGKNFKKLRERAGLSRKEAAAALGITVNGLYFWESSRSFPRPTLWDDLINLYKFDHSELIKLAGGKDSPRVRRYLAQQQQLPERRGKRIYVRSKPEAKQHPEPQPEALIDHQKTDLSDLLLRINDLEQQVAKLKDSMEIVQRMEQLLQAWKQFKKALEVS